MPEILSSTNGAVRLLMIANEAKRNAITHDMARQLLKALRAADADPGIRAVVIAGAGDKAFSSGHDLNEPMSDETGDGDLAFGYPRQMAIPVLAAVSGHCHAAGLMLALACDIRIADKAATFGSPGAKLGMLPIGGQTYLLPRIMTPGRAKLFMMAAKPISGAVAFDWGLVDDLAPDGAALDYTMDLAQQIAANSPAVVGAIKAAGSIADDLDSTAQKQWEAKTSDNLMEGADAVEGLLSARQKRSPVFADRALKGAHIEDQ